MRLRKSMRLEKITAIKGGIVEVVSYVTGLPIPLGVIEKILKIIKEDSPPHFVDWELRDWPKIYHQEAGRWVKLPYKGEKHFLPQALIFDNTTKKLNLSNIHFRRLEKPFDLSNNERALAICALTEDCFEKLLNYLRKKRSYSNEQNLRLVDIIEEQEKVMLEVQPVEYKYYVHTNLVLDVKPKEQDQTLRELLHSNGKLEDLNKSSLADLLGINILLFTVDGSLIIQKRSKREAFRTGELCPAASGTISLTDVPTTITLEEMPKLREAFEEIGIIQTDIPKDQIFFLGITRELVRGGTADMFFFAKTNLSKKQIEKKWKDARDKWESEKLIFFHFGDIAHGNLNNWMERHGFLCKVDEFIDKYKDESSIPLLTSVALWVKYRIGGNFDG